MNNKDLQVVANFLSGFVSSYLKTMAAFTCLARDTPNRFVQLNSWPAEGAVYGLLSSRCCSFTLHMYQENTIYSKPKDLTGRSVTSLKRLWCNRTVFGERLLSCTAFSNSATTFSHPAFGLEDRKWCVSDYKSGTPRELTDVRMRNLAKNKICT